MSVYNRYTCCSYCQPHLFCSFIFVLWHWYSLSTWHVSVVILRKNFKTGCSRLKKTFKMRLITNAKILNSQTVCNPLVYINLHVLLLVSMILLPSFAFAILIYLFCMMLWDHCSAQALKWLSLMMELFEIIYVLSSLLYELCTTLTNDNPWR